jgi:acyl carrier protein
MQTLSERVMEVIARTQKIPIEEITLDKNLEDLGIDSFDGINLLFALEDEFKIIIPNEGKELKTVQEIVFGMEKLIKKQCH